MKPKLAFVGAGKMVTAMVEGLLRNEIFSPEQMVCTSAPDGTAEKLSASTGIGVAESLESLLASGPERVLLGCKPYQLAELDTAILDACEGSLVLSIMAGKTLASLREKFSKARNVVRSMPNIPGQIGAGVTGYLFASPPTVEDEADVKRILSALGVALKVEEERHIDCITAISGSGPAYVFEFACALEAAAESLGFDKERARILAIETVLGAGRLMAHSELDPETLRNNVTSPNGTTQAALESFAAEDYRGMVQRAAQAAYDRSIELSNA
jgi:pyrroline-5-carboxylate reductase